MAKRVWFLLIVGVLGALVIWRQSRSRPPVALSQWSEVVAFDTPPRRLDWARAQAHPSVREAADGTDPDRLRAAMREAGLRGLWVAAAPAAPAEPELPLVERFSAGGIIRGFRGKVLTAEGFLYLIDETDWPPALSDRVLARVARRILEGSEPPPLEAFPEALGAPQPVEVLVMLTGARGPRLWRSARAPSIADGVVTASLAARKRWEERAETMGGSLDERLDQLDVHVALLFDDGTFEPSAVPLIDALVKPGHGVAYEQPARWRYLLPKATHNAESPTDAFRWLFRDNGMPEDSFDRRDLRLYRFRMETVSVDQGSAGSRRTLAPSGSEASDSNGSSAGSGTEGSRTTNVVP